MFIYIVNSFNMKNTQTTDVMQNALKWWATLNHYKQNHFADKYYQQERLSVKHETDKIVEIYSTEYNK